MFKQFILIFVSMFILSANAFADEAPFDLEWGLTLDEVKAMGVVCEDEIMVYDVVISCKTSSVPKNLSTAETYSLYFFPDQNLQKVFMTSETISDDLYGTEGKNTYLKLQGILTKKYGEPEKYEWVGRALYNERDEFYECLDYSGCGTYSSYFTTDYGGDIGLRLEGLGRGEGYITLAYEGPKFTIAMAAIEDQKAAQDIDAL